MISLAQIPHDSLGVLNRLTIARTVTVDLQSASSLTAVVQTGTCFIEANGDLDFVSEICEQLGWLGSALRSSSVEDGVAVCFPKIVSLDVQANAAHGPGVHVVVYCTLGFSLEPLAIKSHELGFCWSSLFRNPVLVTGYPVPRRKITSPGLEIPVNVMAELIRSRRISSFCGRRMIKGFCTILVPVSIASETIAWHLFFNSNGTRISYVDDRLKNINYEASTKLSSQDIQTKRHIVGWCSNIVDFTGTSADSFTLFFVYYGRTQV